MNKKYIVITVIALALGWFAYYTISPLFINIKLDENIPVSNGEDINSTIETKPLVMASAPVVGTVGHPASGNVLIVETDGKSYVRYEDFKTINGPDIFVYLAKDLDAKEYVDLGAVKATEGNVNYEIPKGVNLADYKYVMVWCRAFGVLFNYADLSQVR